MCEQTRDITHHRRHIATMSSTSIHADPPPPVVTEPTGISYATGGALGKGGFAICHKAERYDGSRPTGQIVALKIVKTRMEPAKLAQKVGQHTAIPQLMLMDRSSSRSCKYTANSPIRTSSAFTAPSRSTPVHTSCSSSVRMGHWRTCSRNGNKLHCPRSEDWSSKCAALSSIFIIDTSCTAI